VHFADSDRRHRLRKSVSIGFNRNNRDFHWDPQWSTKTNAELSEDHTLLFAAIPDFDYSIIDRRFVYTSIYRPIRLQFESDDTAVRWRPCEKKSVVMLLKNFGFERVSRSLVYSNWVKNVYCRCRDWSTVHLHRKMDVRVYENKAFSFVEGY
jgi:hypothetical protein